MRASGGLPVRAARQLEGVPHRAQGIACDDSGNVALQMPFIKKAPRVSFRKPIGSVSVSGHKFIGAPVPCGVVITRQKVFHL